MFVKDIWNLQDNNGKIGRNSMKEMYNKIIIHKNEENYDRKI